MPSQISVKVKPKEVSKFKIILAKNENVQFVERKSQYEEFRAKFKGFPIIGYTTGKIVYLDEPETKKLVVNSIGALAKEKVTDIVVGSDEAGKGEWLGPLVASAVALDHLQAVALQASGVMDSKELSTDRIRELAKSIKEISLATRNTLIPPEKFNKLFPTFKKEGKSLNDLLAWAHATAIKEVLECIKNTSLKKKIVIDEFDKFKTEKRLARVIKSFNVEVIQFPRAEENIAVAAASIMARDAYETWLDTLSRDLKIDLRQASPKELNEMGLLTKTAKTDFLK